jgi:hypothetical protein
MESIVHALPSLQSAGQLPSHVSPGSTTRLPQLAEQSLSLLLLQPAGQQPSPVVHWVSAWCAHAALHVDALPVIESCVHGFLSSQSAGQLPSQVSPVSTTPLPQDAEQSLSVPELHPAGQQPSPPLHWLIDVWAQAASHLAMLPDTLSAVQALPSSQSFWVGQLPSHTSLGSTTPFPHPGSQSLSLPVLQPGAQQPSPVLHSVML